MIAVYSLKNIILLSIVRTGIVFGYLFCLLKKKNVFMIRYTCSVSLKWQMKKVMEENFHKSLS